MARKVLAHGPRPADIMLVGEAPGEHETRLGIPFVGASGQELDRMLHEVGILRTECFITNVVKFQPPSNDIDRFYIKNTPKSRVPGPEMEAGIKELICEIDEVKPKVIIALGDTALWALTGNRGIVKWRGSELRYTSPAGHTSWLIPTYHPAAILRMWDWRFSAICDLSRAVSRRNAWPDFSYPSKNFTIRPTFAQAIQCLSTISKADSTLRIAADIETRSGHIACIGFAWSREEALCIPLMCVERNEGYWSFEEEEAIIHALRAAFRNPHIEWIFQNGLYDLQYIARFWAVTPSVHLDTMLGHHACFTGLPKSLDFLSSIYCERHVYWKDDGKNWDPSVGEDQLWTYNCEDCVRTWEISFEVEKMAKDLARTAQVAFQMRQFPAVLRMMLRGVKCDTQKKGSFIFGLEKAKETRQKWLDTANGGAINIRSPKQMQTLLYTDLGLPVQKNRKTGKTTTDDEALEKLGTKNLWLKPLLSRIQELRSLGVFLSTFAMMGLDRDGRIRCSFNIAGTETLRYSSSGNAFGSGTNLQNIPSGEEDSDLPNVKTMFIPDLGCEFADIDLKGADAQVVAWEANDDLLKEIFRSGADIHTENAKTIFTGERTPNAHERAMAKRGVHLTNYGGSSRTLAISLGITTHQAEHFQRRWFAAHPGIPDWHKRVDASLSRTRSVANTFGFVRHYFGRIEGLLPEALAWIPQSTVAVVICTCLINIHERLRDVQPLLQVHDSLLLQYPEWRAMELRPKILDACKVVVPYEDPLIIPAMMKNSTVSWGDCK